MTSVFRTHRDQQFARYEIDIHIPGKLVGGQPKDPRLVEGWLSKSMGLEDDELKAKVVQHLHEMGVDISAADSYEDIRGALEATAGEIKTQGFKRMVDGAPYIEARHLKALIKESTNIVYPRGSVKFGTYLSVSGKKAGQMVGGKNAKEFVAERVFVLPDTIRVADDISGVELAVGHITDPRTFEKRSTIGYFEYVAGVTFTAEILAHNECLTDEQWAMLWTHAELNGLGAMRSQGYGQFEVTRWARV